jgi:glyoxylase-like metal-dependent hydrolase (beta-lactamase superfamily II)
VLCIAGDAVNAEENFTTGVPGGIHVSVADAIASTEKIRRCADRVLMAHDPRVGKYQHGDFPQVPRPAAVVS